MLSILKASAGSGKTFRLTKEYIIMLLGNKVNGKYVLNKSASNAHRAILAITFTNAATEEMKQRIVQELAVLAHIETDNGTPRTSDYLSDLLTLFQCTPDELVNASRQALTRLLFDFNYFHISTIDSFFQLILRTFAFEAELEGDYEIDLDDKAALRNGVSEMLSDLNTSAPTSQVLETEEWIKTHMMQSLEDGTFENPFNRDSSLFKDLTDILGYVMSNGTESIDSRLADWINANHMKSFKQALAKKQRDIVHDTKAQAETALNLIDNSGLQKYLYRGIDTILTNALNGKINDITSKTIYKITDEPTAWLSSAGKVYFKDGAHADQFNTIHSTLLAILEAIKQEPTIRTIRKQLFALGLLGHAIHTIKKLRTENHTIQLKDTNALLRRLIGDDDAPFVFERVGVELQHFLIDEFQDTALAQWEILRPLVNESQAGGNDNLIIGDEKQCIYRWRGSNPSLIRTHVLKDVTKPIKNENLAHNYRSRPEVIEFNNIFFSTLAEQFGFTDLYAEVVQKVPERPNDKDPHRGYVSIRAFNPPKKSSKKKEEENPLSDIEQEQPSIFDDMHQEIRRQIIDSGYLPSEICILVRENADGEEIIAGLTDFIASDPELTALGVRVTSGQSLIISKSTPVRRLIATLRTIAASTDVSLQPSAKEKQYAARQKMHTRSETINLINRFETLVGSGINPNEAIVKAIAHCNEPCHLDIDYTKAGSMNLPTLVEQLIDRHFSSGQVPPEQMMYVMAFQDIVLQFCRDDNAGLHDFLTWWDQTGFKKSVSPASDKKAINVMTIHKSKGLEFKCLHIPFNDSKFAKDHKSFQWFNMVTIPGIDPEITPPIIPLKLSTSLATGPFAPQYIALKRESMLDALNLLYVAFTRASRELIVWYNRHSSKSSADIPELGLFSTDADRMIETALNALAITDSQGNYTSGAPTRPHRKSKIKHIIEPDNANMPAMKLRHRNDILQHLHVPTLREQLMGHQRGTILHDIMASIPDVRHVTKAVRAAVQSRVIDPTHAAEFEQRITHLLTKTNAARWFAPGVQSIRERSILLPSGGEKHKNIPDRVVMLPDGSIEVVDYKFGEKSTSHHTQVRNYCRLIKSMGHTNVRGFLWYVDKGSIIEVPIDTH